MLHTRGTLHVEECLFYLGPKSIFGRSAVARLARLRQEAGELPLIWRIRWPEKPGWPNHAGPSITLTVISGLSSVRSIKGRSPTT
jgi:hypothetical protein